MAGDLAGGHAGGRRYAFYFPFAFKLLDTSVDLSGIMVVTGNRLCIYPGGVLKHIFCKIF